MRRVYMTRGSRKGKEEADDEGLKNRGLGVRR